MKNKIPNPFLDAIPECYIPECYIPEKEEVIVECNETIHKFTFYSGEPEKTWLIEITKDGISFNREFYPGSTPDDFAESFIDILEYCYDVTFEKRKK